MTVVTPEKSAEQLRTDKEDREREINIQDRIRLFTGLLVFVGVLQFVGVIMQAAIYRKQLNTHRTVDRAYVLVSHQTRLWGNGTTPSLARALDLRGATDASGPREIWFTIEMQNHGNTPADIIGGGVWIRTLPDSFPPQGPTLDLPLHYPVRIPPAFVVPNDHPSLTSMIWLPTDVWTRVEEGTEWLWLMGHIDYRDSFGYEHRAGYGRWFDRTRSQLVFHETTGGMNYDRLLTADDKRRYQQAITRL